MKTHQRATRSRGRLLPAALSLSLSSLALAALPAVLAPVAAAAAPVPIGPDAVAQAAAVASGKPVVVDADTTGFSQVTANPNGSFTLTTSVAPQRVRQAGGWLPVDATLLANADGTWSPRAAAGGLTLSGGGTGPLATFDDRAGHQLSVTMPMRLPAPQITGTVALYPSVLPGVDLSVTAQTDGGIREVLIVRDATAAANPALATLRLTTSAYHLEVSTGTDGTLAATDPTTGTAVFTAPPPVMWDSAATAPHVTGLARSMGSDAAPADPAGEPAASSAAGPGANATVTAIPTSLRSGVLTLAPPAAALTGRSVVYPAYVDPGVSGALNAYAYTQSFHTTRVAYKPTDNLRVGFDDWTTNCGSPCYQNGISRTFLYFTNLTAIDGNDVTAASLQFNQIGASCSGTYTINAAITSGNAAFGSNLDWANQPAASSVKDSVGMNGTSGGKTITLTTVGPYMAAHGYTHVYLEVYASSETDHCTWRHFALDPSLALTYWSTPNAPASLTEVNGGATYPCDTTSPGTWITKATNNQVSINDTVSTPDANTALTSNMYLSTNGGSFVDNTAAMTESGANVAIPVSKTLTLTDGSSYRWYATGANAFLTSATSPSGAPTTTCNFHYDGTSPATPGFASTAYPAAGPTTVTTGGAGDITVTSSDGGTNPSGLATIKYDIDGTGIATGGITGTATPVAGSATVSVSLSALHWGTNVLWAQAVDTAGNLSAAVSYTFYVQQSAFGAYTAGTAGDLDADNHPDLVTVDTAGDIQLYSNPSPGTVDPTGDTVADPYQYGGRVLLRASSNARWPDPDSASAAGALIAHAGSFTGNNYDDLLVEQNGFLGVAANPGGAGTWSFATTNVPKPACGTCPNYNGQDWSSVLAMVAVPNAAGAAPDLLTEEFVNGTVDVWRYTPVGGVYRFNPPTLVSTSFADWNWNNVELIGAGPLPGTTGQTLWIRTRDTGRIDTFPNITAGISGDPATAAHSVLGSGFLPAQYPLISTIGRADANGDMPIWATDAAGDLVVIPTSTTTGGVSTLGTPAVLNATGNWAAHQVALGDSYTTFNNNGIGTDGSPSGAFDTATSNANAYSATALANATLDNGAVSACPPSWTSTCPAGVAGGSAIVVPLASGGTYVFTLPAPWAQLNDDYIAAGQVLPAPIPNTSGPAHTISFLGAGVTSDSVNGASVGATVTYTDGHTQAITVTFGDWTHNNDAAPIGGETTVAVMDHRLTAATGASGTKVTYLFASAEITLLDNGAPLPAGVQIASITLGSNAAVHIFSTALQ